jgi:hypothetical protein
MAATAAFKRRNEGMSKQVVNRLTLGVLLIATVTLLAAAGGSSAGGFAFSTQTVKSHDAATPISNQCPGLNPPIAERHYCLDVTTYSNLKKSGGAEVDLTFENWDQSTLNKPTAQLTWTNDGVNLSFVSSNPAICSSPPAGGEVDCSFPNIPGLGSASGTVDPCHPLGPSCQTVKLFFTIDSTIDSVSFAASATAKESGNDNNSAANVETQTVDSRSTGGPPVMSFDNGTGAGENADATVVLPKSGFNKPHLSAALARSSVDCQFFCLASGSAPFIAQFAAGTGTTACFPGITCTGLELTTDFSGAAPGTFSASNQILWQADVASNNTNVLAVHTYDSVPITPSPPNTLTTAGTSFAKCDGVVFDSFGSNPQSNLTLGQIYFVRNATTKGTNTSFQVSTTAKGSIIAVTGTSSISGSCVRIIGNDPVEKLKPCTATDAPVAPTTPPGICAAKIDNSTVRVYLWDSANGGVHI